MNTKQPVHIVALEAENFKRLKAVTVRPTEEHGLTVIGGRNAQGKTSALDAIIYALGGEKYRPTEPNNRNGDSPAKIRLELSNGIVVERAGKNAALKVTDAEGKKGGQALLDEFTENLALNLPKFLEGNAKAKARTLLKILGINDELDNLDAQEKDLYEERRVAAKLAEDADTVAENMVRFPDAPGERVSTHSIDEALDEAAEKTRERAEIELKIQHSHQQRGDLEVRIDKAEAELKQMKLELELMAHRTHGLGDELAQVDVPDVAKLKEKRNEAVEVNRQVDVNAAYAAQVLTASDKREVYQELAVKVNRVRAKRDKLLESAEMPLEELTVVDGELVYRGSKWDGMGAAEQMKVATSIVRKIKPECGFILLDKLEQLDPGELQKFGAWAEAEGLQIIATRVSTGEECSIIIEDGEVALAE